MDAANALESWFREQPGAYLHPSVHISHSPGLGGHWRADAPIEAGARLATVPHSLAFSHLNALVDDAFPVFKQQRMLLGVENTGFFYLMLQHLNRHESFWKHYLNALPKPEDGHTTPLWFDNAADEAWLADTDAAYTAKKRREAYLRQYESGIAVLSKAGLDTSSLTWDFFRWAVTMYTSRSFSSRSLAPQDSKYWAAYKTAANGSRQAVLLDLSHASADDRNFSVLFPVIDSANHIVDAQVDWTFDPGRFSLATVNPVQTGAEVYNNYGPKGNDELLLGYGFCIPDNPNDTMMLTLKPPSADLQSDLRSSHAGYFDESKQWSSEKATFRLRRIPGSLESAEDIFNKLPSALLELLTLIIRSERDLRFETVSDITSYLLEPASPGRQYLPFIARMIVTSLAPKLQKLHARTAELPAHPRNPKQAQAKIYRDGQMEIMSRTTTALRQFLRSLRPQASDVDQPSGGKLVTIEEALALPTLPQEAIADFMRGIETNANTSDLTQLCRAGWEEDIWVLLLCYTYIWSSSYNESPSTSENLPPSIPWLVALAAAIEKGRTWVVDKDDDEEGGELMPIVRQAKFDVGGVWGDRRWTEVFIREFGGRVLRHQGFAMMVMDAEGVEEQRLVVYLHGT